MRYVTYSCRNSDARRGSSRRLRRPVLPRSGYSQTYYSPSATAIQRTNSSYPADPGLLSARYGYGRLATTTATTAEHAPVRRLLYPP